MVAKNHLTNTTSPESLDDNEMDAWLRSPLALRRGPCLPLLFGSRPDAGLAGPLSL